MFKALLNGTPFVRLQAALSLLFCFAVATFIVSTLLPYLLPEAGFLESMTGGALLAAVISYFKLS